MLGDALLACTDSSVDALGAALGAGALAIVSTLLAKRRPAGARTRATDRRPRQPMALELGDDTPEDVLHDGQYVDQPPRPRSRVRRALKELRIRHTR